MHRITERIYIGGIAEASNEHFIKGNEIGAVLALCEDLPDSHKGVALVHVPFADTQFATDAEIARAVRALHNMHAKSESRILVHCHAGISRSPTVVAIFLALKNGWSFKRALEYVERGRPVAWPNPSFKRRAPRIIKEMRSGRSPDGVT
jgi:atypical dual specificity phosphatase